MRTVGGSRPRGHIEVYIKQVICHYKPRISNIVPRKRRAKGYCVHFRDIGRRGIDQGATLNHREMNTAADSGDPPFLDPCQTEFYSSSRSSEVTRLDPIPVNSMVDRVICKFRVAWCFNHAAKQEIYRALAHLEIEEGQVIRMPSAMKSCLCTVLYSMFK